MQTFDCIVVGAGPAGSTALRTLARLGVRAAALDKHDFPRYKPCGGAISALTAKQLDFAWEDLIEDALHQVDLTYKSAPPLTVKTDRPYAHFVMRDRFDDRLVRMAQQEGGTFLPGHGVTGMEKVPGGYIVHTTRRALRARYVIGADGANGIVAREIGLFQRERGIAMEAEITAPEGVLDTYRRRAVIQFADPPWGYAWIFPKADKLSVGVGTFSHRREAIKPSFQRFLKATGLDRWPMDVYGHPIPTGGTYQPLWKPRVVLTGDAAGLNDPLSGEGIAHAIFSGKTAAHHVHEALKKNTTTFEAYEDEIYRHTVGELEKARWIAGKLYAFPRLFYWLLAHSPSTMELYFRLVRGEVQYGDVTAELSRLFFRFNLFKTAGSSG